MITTTGLAFASALIGNTSSPVGMLYIAYGTGTTAEAAAQTALVTEVARVAATFTKESILGPNDTLKWYGTATLAAGATVTEIGVFNQATVGGGMLFRKKLTTPVTFTTGQKIGMIARLTAKNDTYSFA